MSSPRSIVYRMLNADHTDDKGALAFYDALLEIDEELADLEYRISEVPLGLTGFHAQQELSKYESKYVALKQEIKEAQQAVIYDQPTKLERFDNDLYSGRTNNEFINYTNRYNKQIGLLEEHSHRVGERLEGKRNSANARMSATISVCAVVVSVFTLILSTLGVV